MIKLLQSMEWSKLCWDQSCEPIVSLESVLPKIGLEYIVTLGDNEYCQVQTNTKFLWKPPHSDMNTWSDDRPWEIFDSYIIYGKVIAKTEDERSYRFRVAEITSFYETILNGEHGDTNILPVLGCRRGEYKSVFESAFRTEVYHLKELIYLSCSECESFYELIFTKKNEQLIALFSAALPYAGYYAEVSKYTLNSDENMFFNNVINNAIPIEDNRDSSLKIGFIKGLAWM